MEDKKLAKEVAKHSDFEILGSGKVCFLICLMNNLLDSLQPHWSRLDAQSC